ncbi:MAG: hypothetical protein E7163_05870, partial [Firmicutes bacterium]|nr:hypothetical protein [Bacillota bacterium]
MKIKHILLSIVLVLVCGFSFINVEASVKETIDDFSGNTYIIGSTKFDNDTIITAGRAAQAGSDDAVIRYMKTGVFERVEVKIYLYNERAEAWFEIPVDETKDIVILDEKEVKSLEENLDIFFVNNEEKQLEFPYSGDIDLETLESNESVSGLKVTYKDGKFYIPATTTNVSFKDSEGEDIYISTGYDTEDEEYGLGEFYIPKRVKAVDESGKDLGISILAAKDGLVYDYGNLYSFSKPYYDLYYVDKNGVEIDFYTWKVTEDTTIKQAWHPIGDLVTDNFSYEFESEKQFIVHKGNLYKTDGGYYFNARIIAPHGYDTSDTLVNGEKVVFKEVGIAGEDAHMEAIVKVPITQLNEVNVVVDWEEGEKVTFNVKISQDVNYVYNATFYNNADEIIDTKEADSWGGLVQKTDIVLKKDNAVHIGWTLEKNSNELYDFNTSLTNNIKLYPVFVSLKDFILKSVVNDAVYHAILPSDIKLTETVVLDFDGDISLDLNGHDVSIANVHAIRLKGNNTLLNVTNGTFTTTGNAAGLAIGTDKESTSSVTRRSLYVGSDVIINAETFGIVAFGKSQLDFYGTINISGDGYGISGNGNPNNEGTIFNIHEGAIINAPNGAAIYQPQQGTTNINGGTFEANTILGIKAGNLNVSDGTFKAIGTPTNPKASNNGINLTGDIF